jgi:hypothetical protein
MGFGIQAAEPLSGCPALSQRPDNTDYSVSRNDPFALEFQAVVHAPPVRV